MIWSYQNCREASGYD